MRVLINEDETASVFVVPKLRSQELAFGLDNPKLRLDYCRLGAKRDPAHIHVFDMSLKGFLDGGYLRGVDPHSLHSHAESDPEKPLHAHENKQDLGQVET